jgi:hypothetical protein
MRNEIMELLGNLKKMQEITSSVEDLVPESMALWMDDLKCELESALAITKNLHLKSSLQNIKSKTYEELRESAERLWK